jgi:hypothetical protein
MKRRIASDPAAVAVVTAVVRAATENTGSVESAPGRNTAGVLFSSKRLGRTMAWRKTGLHYPAQEILVMTCDVCERDIGNEDGRRPHPHFLVSRHPNAGTIDDQEPPVTLCSRECLRAFAANASGPDRAPAGSQ